MATQEIKLVIKGLRTGWRRWFDGGLVWFKLGFLFWLIYSYYDAIYYYYYCLNMCFFILISECVLVMHSTWKSHRLICPFLFLKFLGLIGIVILCLGICLKNKNNKNQNWRIMNRDQLVLHEHTLDSVIPVWSGTVVNTI